jgi:hypothetical protein
MADKNLNINIVAKDKSKQALGKLQGNLSKTKSSVLNLKNALIGLGAGLVIRSIVQTTATFQDLRTSLASVTGSAEQGAAAFDFITGIATKTQFSVEDLSRSFIKLKAAGITPSEEILNIFTNTAAITTDQIGSLEAVTDLFARTVSGGLGLEEIQRLGDRGVPILRILEQELGLNRSQISEFGKSAEGAQKIVEAFGRGIQKEFGGATVALLDNLNVSFSNFGIALRNVQDKIGQGMSPALKGMTDQLTKMLEENEDLAVSLGEGLGGALQAILITTLKTVEAFDKLNKKLEDNKTYEILGSSVKDLLVDVFDLGFGLGTLREEFPELAKKIDELTNSTKPLSDGFLSSAESADNFHNSLKAVQDAMSQMSDDTSTKSTEKNTEALSKNMQLAISMQQFAIRNSEIMKTINHAEIERMKKLDEEVERAFKRQEARNKRKVQLEKDAQREIVSATETGLSALSGLNKTAFKAYQAFQAGMTIINTYRAISNALATYPPPLNFAVAAAQGAAGFAQVAAIRSQSFSARQTGGAVVAGQPYMVGEAGSEIMIPSTNGTIVPNDKIGGGSTTVNFNITTVDAKGFEELLTNSRGTIVGMINSAVNEQGRASLV